MPTANTVRIHPDGIPNPGTLGCVLTGTPPGGTITNYFLTCAHVVGPAGQVAVGAKLLADDGTVMGTVTATTNPLIDRIDVAVCQLAVTIDARLGELGMPRGWTSMVDVGTPLRVATVDFPNGVRCTIKAMGQPQDTDIPLLGGNSATRTLQNMILADRGSAGAQLHSGDSGAAVLDDSGLIVGIFEAITADGTQAVITPILDALGILSTRAGLSLAPLFDNSPIRPQVASLPPPNDTKQARGQRNKNPGNVRYLLSNAWLGLDDPPSDGLFCRFTDVEWGIRVICYLLLKYRNKYGRKSVAGLISKWAPRSENNTSSYIIFVSGKMGVDPNQDVNISNQDVMLSLVKAIIQFEIGIQPYSDAVLETGWNWVTAPP